MYRVVFAFLLAAGASRGQTFEAASLKPAASGDWAGKGDPQGTISIGPASLTMRNVSLRDMIEAAYGIRDFQLSGPAWMKSDRYDLTAKVAGETPAAQMRTMLQGLLADRFKLAIHRDTKEMAVDTLVAGKSAPKVVTRKQEGPANIAIDKGGMVFQNYTMAKLADYISQRSPDRPTVDATGIEGYFDVTIPLVDAGSEDPGAVKRAMGQAMRDGSLGRLAAEQLGLKLETRKGPTEIVVVDHAERTPAEN